MDFETSNAQSDFHASCWAHKVVHTKFQALNQIFAHLLVWHRLSGQKRGSLGGAFGAPSGVCLRKNFVYIFISFVRVMVLGVVFVFPTQSTSFFGGLA